MEYPSALLSQLKPNDSVVAYLRLLSPKTGCLKPKIPEGFVVITEQRVIVKGAEFNSESKVVTEFTTNVPISKVSSMTVIHKQHKGCLNKNQSYFLSLNIQGAQHDLFVGNTSETANEFVRTFVDLSE